MFRREARGQRLGVIRRNVFPLASCPWPLAWLLCDFATNRHEYCGLTFCKAASRRSWRSGVANDLALHEIDDQLGDVGGMIGHPFEVFGNETQANSA